MTRSTRRRAVAAAAAVLLAGCAGPATGASRSGTTPTAAQGAAAGADPGAATTAPTITHRMERVTVAGTAIEVAIVEPDGFRAGEVHPVLLALPPGGQDRQTTEKVVDQRWAGEARRLGWVVISPVAPDGVPFYEAASARLVPGLLDALAPRFPAEGGKPHLAGISNGGLSAFRVALDHPERFASLSTLPGYPPEPGDAAHLGALVGLPVALYVGGDDAGWREESEKTAAALHALGGSVSIDVVAGDDHFLRSLPNAAVFERLESFRHPGP